MEELARLLRPSILATQTKEYVRAKGIGESLAQLSLHTSLENVGVVADSRKAHLAKTITHELISADTTARRGLNIYVVETAGMSKSLNILIADSDAIVAELLGTYLELNGMRGKAALDLKNPESIMMSGADAEAVLVDPNLPGLSSSDDLGRLVQLAKPRPVILLASSVKQDFLHSVLNVGVRGLIPKSASLRTLSNAIRFVMAGEVFVPAELLSQALDRNREGTLNLSQKELEVLRRLQMGRMNKEIALDLGISVVSVKVLVRSLCNKLSAKNRTQVAVLASKMPLD